MLEKKSQLATELEHIFNGIKISDGKTRQQSPASHPHPEQDENNLSMSPTTPARTPANLLIAAQRGHWKYIAAALDKGSVLTYTTQTTYEKKFGIRKKSTSTLCSVECITPELLNRRDESGKTLLHYAAAFGPAPLMRKLVENGADHTLADNDRFTPLYLASSVSLQQQRRRKLAILLPQTALTHKITDLDHDYTPYWGATWKTLHSACHGTTAISQGTFNDVIRSNLEHLITLSSKLNTASWEKMLLDIDHLPNTLCPQAKKNALKSALLSEKRHYLEKKHGDMHTCDNLPSGELSATDIILKNTIFENPSHREAFEDVFAAAAAGDLYSHLLVTTMAVRCMNGTKLFIANGNDIGSLYPDAHFGIYKPLQDFLIISGGAAVDHKAKTDLLGQNFFHESVHAILQEADTKHAHKMKPFPCRRTEPKENKVEKNRYIEAYENTCNKITNGKKTPSLLPTEAFILDILDNIFIDGITLYSSRKERYQEYIAKASQTHFISAEKIYFKEPEESAVYQHYAAPILTFMQETLQPVMTEYLRKHQDIVAALKDAELVQSHLEKTAEPMKKHTPPPVPARRSASPTYRSSSITRSSSMGSYVMQELTTRLRQTTSNTLSNPV